MSRILLERADTEPVSFDERLVLKAEQLGEDVVSVDTLAIRGTVEKAGEGYALAAEVRGSGTLRCVRCLEPFGFSFDERVSVSLVSAAAAPSEDETRLGRADLEVLFYGEPEVDLGAMAAEQVQLATPMKPLCREDCRGLCPRCGANWNATTCACPTDDHDERWAPLGEWRSSH